MPAAEPPARPTLTRQRCWNHAEREAAARCPSCARFYCRECVTEHAGRMICATCLRAQFAADKSGAAAGPGRTSRLLRAGVSAIGQAGQIGIGLLVAWFFFYLVGQKLAALPEKFHEGTFWKQTLFGETDQ